MKKEYLLALPAVMLWGTISPVYKLVLGTLDEMFVLFVTGLIAAAVLLVVLIAQGKLKALLKLKLKDWAILAVLAILGSFLYNLFYMMGIARLSSQEACIINYLWPMMIVLFSWPVLHEKLTGRSFCALALSFFGIVVMVTRLDLSFFLEGSIAGVIACVGAAVCYGLFSVLNKRYDYDQTVAMTVMFGLTGVLAGIALLIRPVPVKIESAAIVGGLVWMGAMADGIAYLLWCSALARGNTARVSNIAYLTPFLSILWAKVLINEPVSLYSFIGLAFILLGLLIQFWKKKA